jgi:hypothetical protein
MLQTLSPFGKTFDPLAVDRDRPHDHWVKDLQNAIHRPRIELRGHRTSKRIPATTQLGHRSLAGDQLARGPDS